MEHYKYIDIYNVTVQVPAVQGFPEAYSGSH